MFWKPFWPVSRAGERLQLLASPCPCPRSSPTEGLAAFLPETHPQRHQVETGPLDADAEAAACLEWTLLPCLLLPRSVFKLHFWGGRDKGKVLKPVSLL